jgi:hypothetical protein
MALPEGNQVIPDEAVEAAWEQARADRDDVRRILEAAAPFFAAKALEDAATEFEDNMGVGEFEEWARRDGRRWNHIEESWEHQGPYMDWLRARAAAVRGEG